MRIERHSQKNESRPKPFDGPGLGALGTLDLHADCEVAFRPLLQLMELTRGDYGENSRVHKAVVSLYQIVADMRQLCPLSDPAISFVDRVAWIRLEMQKHARALPGEDKNHLKQYRGKFAENEHGVPQHWDDDVTAQKERETTGIVLSHLRSFAAAVTTARDTWQAFATTNRKAADIQLTCSAARLHTLSLYLCTGYEGAAEVKLEHDALNHAALDLDLDRSRQRGVTRTVQEHFDEILVRYDALYAKILHQLNLPELPKGTRLLEFDMRITDCPDQLVTAVSKLADSLVIDRSVHAPQEGFGRRIPAEEIRDLLQHRGAKLFCLMDGEQVIGFHTLLPERSNLPTPLQEAFRVLEAIDPFARNRRNGGCEIFGIAKEVRRPMAREGIIPSEAMHQAVLHSARTEQLETLVGYCRAGEQANTALCAHERMGWQVRTTFQLEGGTYHLITLDVRIPESNERRTHTLERRVPDQGDRTAYDALSLPPVTQERAAHAAPITDADAILWLREKFRRQIKSIPTSEGLAISITLGGLQFVVHQVLPGRDHWFYHNQTESGVEGNLATVAEVVWKDLYKVS